MAAIHAMLRFPPAGLALGALCLVYLLPGLIGHDPWKPGDATHFGVAYGLLKGGDWLAPALAGEPFLDQPPLYYWLAAACATVFGGVLDIHDATRLASAVVAAVGLYFLGAGARRLHGGLGGGTAILLAIGCIGLLVPLHEHQPRVGAFAASAAFFFGLALTLERPLRGGLVCGLAAGLGALAAGPIVLLVLSAAALVTAVGHAAWRTPRAWLGLALAGAIGATLFGGYLWTLWHQKPDHFAAWWPVQISSLTPDAHWPARLAAHLELQLWYGWPALPLAGWTLWRERRTLLAPGIYLPLSGLATTAAVLWMTQEARVEEVMPLIVPLVLLAVPGVATLRRGASNALDWFAMMTFSLFSGLIWLGWVAMIFGWPARLARQVTRLEPGFVLQFSPLPLALALLLSAAWTGLIVTSPRGPNRGTLHWAVGVVTLWGLVAALWIPWIDYGKSYRKLAESLARALPQQTDCIAGRDLGDAQRASFEYFAGVLTQPEGSIGARRCSLLLVQQTGRNPASASLAGWEKIWEDRRPGDRQERFRLYRRD